MAIQINGTTVIDNSRQLQNIASLDSATATVIGAAVPPVAIAPANFDPLSAADVTLTSSGTWTKPTSGYAGTTWVTFYIVAGGGGGGGAQNDGTYWRTGGAGGGSIIFAGTMAELPSSLTFTVGAGGDAFTAGTGGTSSVTYNGITYTANGGSGGISTAAPSVLTRVDNYPAASADPFGVVPTNGTSGGTYFNDNPANPSVWGGGAGATGQDTTNRAGGISTYAGNGGRGGSSPLAGDVPGGGGGGSYSGRYNGGAGGSGSVRIYYG